MTGCSWEVPHLKPEGFPSTHSCGTLGKGKYCNWARLCNCFDRTFRVLWTKQADANYITVCFVHKGSTSFSHTCLPCQSQGSHKVTAIKYFPGCGDTLFSIQTNSIQTNSSSLSISCITCCIPSCIIDFSSEFIHISFPDDFFTFYMISSFLPVNELHPTTAQASSGKEPG